MLISTHPGGLVSAIVALLMFGLFGQPAMAQERVTLLTNSTFYADNSEFFNPFRDGETLFGNAVTFAVDVDLTEQVTFRGGIFMNHRYGSESYAEQWRPVFRIDLHSDTQRFIVGTLDTFGRSEGVGLVRTGPHDLLPPLQRETLGFTRPYEAGAQWTIDALQIRQDAWINWQQLNAPNHRERFDTGITGRLPFDTPVPIAVAYHFHLVHEGGQQFNTGPVRDSWAVGPGIVIEPRVWFLDRTTIEGYALFSRNVPDRTYLENSDYGHGIFTRFSGEKNGWRGHLIIWGACNWIKDEGDENYGSLRQDGTRFLPTRHYGEIGLTKIFHPTDGVEVESSARVHRIEKDYDYSYRIIARVGFNFSIWTP